MHCKLSLVVVITITGLIGCTLGPDYVRPEVKLPEHFHNEAALDTRKSRTNADIVNWWTSFEDPLLTRVVTQALEQNLELAQANTRVAQARAGLTAATAALLPSASVNGQASRGYQSLETPQAQILRSAPDYDRYGNLYEANLVGDWELDLFGSLRRERRAALANYQSSEASVVAARLSVAAQTADTYIVIRGLQARLDIARKQASKQEERVKLLTLLYEQGLIAKRQVHQAESALTQAQASIPALEASLTVALNAMDIMLGSSPGTHKDELTIAGAIPVSPKIASDASPGDLLRRRPDLIVAERHLAASNERIGAAIAEYYPKLSLSGLIGSATITSNNLFSSDATQTSGVLGLRWRLFDFGRINAQINLAKAQESENLAAYRLAVLRATEDVENAFTRLINREQQVTKLAQSAASLAQTRQSSVAAFEKGTASMIEVLEIDDSLLRVSDAQVQAQTESARAAVAAFKSLGGGWNSPSLELITSR